MKSAELIGLVAVLGLGLFAGRLTSGSGGATEKYVKETIKETVPSGADVGNAFFDWHNKQLDWYTDLLGTAADRVNPFSGSKSDSLVDRIDKYSSITDKVGGNIVGTGAYYASIGAERYNPIKERAMVASTKKPTLISRPDEYGNRYVLRRG